MNEQALQDALVTRPKLGSECIVTPIVIRQEHWVTVKNPVTGGFTRLHCKLWAVVQELDGRCTLQQWLQTHAQVFGDRQLLSAVLQLQRAGIVNAPANDLPANPRRGSLMSRYNPLMIRVPLCNPTRLLDRLCAASRFISARLLFYVFVTVLSAALYAVFMNWAALVQQWSEIDQGTLVWHFLLLYPLTKCLHELAHGWALRRMGGEVPEAGISLIVLFPMPYVDATDAWSLQRGQRMLVTGAGMLMDLLVASIGIVLWLILSAGVLADMAFSVALMGFVSVVVFNANPLLKFDGYYLLEDALDSPGLARRATAYYRYLGKRYLLFMASCSPPVLGGGEIPWLLVYGFFSTLYRFFIAIVISYYLITTFHELGVILSLFSLIPLCVTPIYRFVGFLSHSQELAGHRMRAVSVVLVTLMLFCGFMFSVPMPSATRTQGVVWVEQQAEVYATQSGELQSVLVDNGDMVRKDQPLMVLRSDDLRFKQEQKRSAVRLARLALSAHQYSDPALASSALTTLQQVQSELEAIRKQIARLTIRSPVSGRIALSTANTIKGSAISQGNLLAYVVNDKQRLIRAVLDQSAIGKMESGVKSVRVRLAQDIGQSLKARIVRQVPSGNHDLPSAALIDTGFGGFKVSPSLPEETVQTREKVFHLELMLTDNLQTIPMGTRAYVTLEHERKPLAQRVIRLSRQLLLKHLNV